MSKKHQVNSIDDADDADGDDFAILGSRFARLASEENSQKFHRARHDSDAWDERATKRKSFRPREKTHRDTTT